MRRQHHPCGLGVSAWHVRCWTCCWLLHMHAMHAPPHIEVVLHQQRVRLHGAVLVGGAHHGVLEARAWLRHHAYRRCAVVARPCCPRRCAQQARGMLCGSQGARDGWGLPDANTGCTRCCGLPAIRRWLLVLVLLLLLLKALMNHGACTATAHTSFPENLCALQPLWHAKCRVGTPNSVQRG